MDALKLGWVALAATSAAILGFGLLTALSDDGLVRAAAVSDVGMGLFGLAISATAYRRGERWVWLALWYLPLFWLAHLVWRLPPGNDHVHQVVFIAVSLVGLLLPARRFFAPA